MHFYQALVTEVCDGTEIAELKLKVITWYVCLEHDCICRKKKKNVSLHALWQLKCGLVVIVKWGKLNYHLNYWFFRIYFLYCTGCYRMNGVCDSMRGCFSLLIFLSSRCKNLLLSCSESQYIITQPFDISCLGGLIEWKYW